MWASGLSPGKAGGFRQIFLVIITPFWTKGLKLQRRSLTKKPVVPRRLYWGLNWGRLQEARVV